MRARAFAQDRGWDESVPVIGFAGRFVPEKGLAVLMQALAQLAVPWRALLVGGGPELPSLQAFSAAHPGRVSIAGGRYARRDAGVFECDGRPLCAEPDDDPVARAVRADAD